MPTSAHSASLVFGAAPGLTAQDRSDITLAFECAQPEVSLEGGHHVAKVLSASLRMLARRVQGPESTALRAEIERLDRVRTLLPATELPRPAAPRADGLTLYSVSLRIDLESADPRLKLRLGALFYEAKTSFARPSQAALRAVLEAAEAAGTARAAVALMVMEQATNTTLSKVLSKLTPRGSSFRTAASSAAERRIELRWSGARSFTNPHKISGYGDDLTATEVIEVAGRVRQEVERGDVLALLVALAHWLGVWLWELMDIEVFRPRGTGLIRISNDCSHAVVDLSGVLGDLAQTHSNLCKPCTQEIILIFPACIAAWLSALLKIRPDAKTLRALTDLQIPHSQSRVPGVPKAHQRRLTVRRFIDSRSAPLIGKVHQHVLALGNLDFERAEKSAYPYAAVASSEILSLQKMRSEQLGWGPLCEVPQPENLHVGSRTTPQRTATIELIAVRRHAAERAHPGPNAGWSLLIAHHNQLVRYVLVMCTLAWMLRGRLAHALPASLMRLYIALGFRDKNVPEASCAPAPMVCGSLMRRQLEYLRSHTMALIARLKPRTNDDPERVALVRELERMAEGGDGASLLQIIVGNTARPAGAQDLGADLPLDWEFNKDALRHFGTDAYRETGSTAEMIELMLRHAGNGFELFSTSCGVSLREWEAEAGDAQDRMLMSLGASPLKGLVAKLAAKQS